MRALATRSGFRMLGVSLGLSTMLPQIAPAQTVRLQPCVTDCGIELSEVTRLGEPSGEGFVGAPAGLVQRSDGLWVLADRNDQQRLKVFDRDGRFLRYVGRAGQGPGEFGIVQHLLLLESDSLLVYDLAGSRFVVFDSQFRPTSTLSVPAHVMDLEHNDDGTLLVMGIAHEPEVQNLPLHIFTRAGERIRSFGAEEGANPREYDLFYRSIAVGELGTMWTAEMTRYRITERTPSGAVVRSLEREVEWFPPHEDYRTFGTEQPPTPGLLDLRVDGNGLLWVLTLVPDPEWSTAFGPPRNVFGRDIEPVEDGNALYDTIIEVIDLSRAEVVASQRFDPKMRRFAGDDLVYSEGVHPNLEPYVRVWRLSLRQ